MLLGVAVLIVLSTGCRCLFSSTQTITISKWHNYSDAEAAFHKIVPYRTTVKDLRALGFHPAVSPNVKVLNYVEIIQTFMPNQAMHIDDLPTPVKDCIVGDEKGIAYLVELQNIHDERHGNLFLDVFGFKRLTHQSGWRFRGIILIKGDRVVYKISSGEPQVSKEERKIKPLGPFQELDSLGGSAVNYAK